MGLSDSERPNLAFAALVRWGLCLESLSIACSFLSASSQPWLAPPRFRRPSRLRPRFYDQIFAGSVVVWQLRGIAGGRARPHCALSAWRPCCWPPTQVPRPSAHTESGCRLPLMSTTTHQQGVQPTYVQIGATKLRASCQGLLNVTTVSLEGFFPESFIC